TTIDVPGAAVNGAYGINRAGDVVGYFVQGVNSMHKHGFLYRGGNFTQIDYPGASSTFAYGINDSGLMTGSAEFSGGATALGFTYDQTNFTPIVIKGKSTTITYAIDNTNDLVGGAGTLYTTKGFELVGGQSQTLKVPGAYVYVFASGINNLDTIVGWADSSGFICRQSSCRILNISGANQTAARGLNDGGMIVGWYTVPGGCACAFAMLNGKTLSFKYPGAQFTAAAAINALGQIVGQYTFDFQTYHGFITSPITTADFVGAASDSP